MIFKNPFSQDVRSSNGVLNDLKRTYQPQIDAGTLTDTNGMRIRRRLALAKELEERSRSENSFSLVGDIVASGKRFFKTGCWSMSHEEPIQKLLAPRQHAEALMAATHDPLDGSCYSTLVPKGPGAAINGG